MGTNYYWRYNICPCCQRYDQQHVGKSSSGFQGVFDEDPETFRDDVPVVTSWAEWKAVLRGEKQLPGHESYPGELWDEYGERLDVEEFIAAREGVSAEHRRRQYDWVADHAWQRPSRPGSIGVVGPDNDWLDADGWSFYGGPFS